MPQIEFYLNEQSITEIIRFKTTLWQMSSKQPNHSEEKMYKEYFGKTLFRFLMANESLISTVTGFGADFKATTLHVLMTAAYNLPDLKLSGGIKTLLSGAYAYEKDDDPGLPDQIFVPQIEGIRLFDQITTLPETLLTCLRDKKIILDMRDGLTRNGLELPSVKRTSFRGRNRRGQSIKKSEKLSKLNESLKKHKIQMQFLVTDTDLTAYRKCHMFMKEMTHLEFITKEQPSSIQMRRIQLGILNCLAKDAETTSDRHAEPSTPVGSSSHEEKCSAHYCSPQPRSDATISAFSQAVLDFIDSEKQYKGEATKIVSPAPRHGDKEPPRNTTSPILVASPFSTENTMDVIAVPEGLEDTSLRRPMTLEHVKDADTVKTNLTPLKETNPKLEPDKIEFFYNEKSLLEMVQFKGYLGTASGTPTVETTQECKQYFGPALYDFLIANKQEKKNLEVDEALHILLAAANKLPHEKLNKGMKQLLSGVYAYRESPEGNPQLFFPQIQGVQMLDQIATLPEELLTKLRDQTVTMNLRDGLKENGIHIPKRFALATQKGTREALNEMAISMDDINQAFAEKNIILRFLLNDDDFVSVERNKRHLKGLEQIQCIQQEDGKHIQMERIQLGTFAEYTAPPEPVSSENANGSAVANAAVMEEESSTALPKTSVVVSPLSTEKSPLVIRVPESIGSHQIRGIMHHQSVGNHLRGLMTARRRSQRQPCTVTGIVSTNVNPVARELFPKAPESPQQSEPGKTTLSHSQTGIHGPMVTQSAPLHASLHRADNAIPYETKRNDEGPIAQTQNGCAKMPANDVRQPQQNLESLNSRKICTPQIELYVEKKYVIARLMLYQGSRNENAHRIIALLSSDDKKSNLSSIKESIAGIKTSHTTEGRLATLQRGFFGFLFCCFKSRSRLEKILTSYVQRVEEITQPSSRDSPTIRV